MEEKKNYISIGTASEYLGVSIDTLRRWEKKGRIEAFRSPGGHRYYAKEDLDTLFGKRYVHDGKSRETIKEQTPVPLSSSESIKTSFPLHNEMYDYIPHVPNSSVNEPIEPFQRRQVSIPGIPPIQIAPVYEPPIQRYEPPNALSAATSQPQQSRIINELLKLPENQRSTVQIVIVICVSIVAVILAIISFILVLNSQNVLSPSP